MGKNSQYEIFDHEGTDDEKRKVQKKAASTHARRPEKFRTPQDLNPDLCNAVAVSHQLSYRAMGLFQAFLPLFIKNCDKHVKLVIGTTYHPSTYP